MTSGTSENGPVAGAAPPASLSSRETICALSTPAGVGGISVVRVCGQNAWKVARALAPGLPGEPLDHHSYFASFLDEDATAIDEGLVLFFAEGKSYAGDETVEINCHGNPQIVDELLKRLISLGCRPAGRGEFTMRAFLNGRLDLAQAEGVLSLIESESKVGRRISLRQLKGDLSKQFLKIEDLLVDVIAHIEASIDFSTEDIEVIDFFAMSAKLKAVLEMTGPLIGSFAEGRKVNHGFIVSLVGEPNAGKSSLLNALLADDRAIVSATAGTTRDVVEASLRLGGRLVLFRDTAGLRVTSDAIEAEGVRRSLKAAEEADLVFQVIDGSEPEAMARLPAERDLLRARLPGTRVVVLVNKIDLISEERALARQPLDPVDSFFVSAKSLVGIPDLLAMIEESSQIHFSAEIGVLTSLRHFEGLKKVQLAVLAADGGIAHGNSSDIVCLDLRDALLSIQTLLGKQFDESVIDRIFSDFCIGK